MYCVDTNVFVDWWERRYSPDVFPSVQKSIEQLAQAGKFIAPELVYEEIQHVGSKGLKIWASKNAGLFLPHDAQLQAEAQAIQFNFPDLIDNTTSSDEADRWVIALAKIKGFSVVTHETSFKAKINPARKLYIPDVCAAMKVPCIELLPLMRQQKWSF